MAVQAAKDAHREWSNWRFEDRAAIFLGKNYLGQKDETTSNLNVKTEVAQMTEEQLMEIAARAPATPRQPPKKESVH